MPQIHVFDTRHDSLGAIVAELRPPLLERYETEERAVRRIVEEVRRRGDAAVVRYTRKFDYPRMTAEALEVSPEAMAAARQQVDSRILQAMEQACDNVRRFHELCLPKAWRQDFDGYFLGVKCTPIRRVGVYAPGGLPLPSSVYMCAIPARVAGVKEIILCTPPTREGRVSPLMLVAAGLSGVDRVFAIGGAQAIAAMAFGTETVPRADKIVGPGNIYVLLAKRAVFGQVGIESLPGPSDVLVIADSSAHPAYVAADMLSQAEHGPNSSAILCTISPELRDAVAEELDRQLTDLPREAEARENLASRGALILCRSLEDCAHVANAIAPEHLEIIIEGDPERLLDLIENAGAIFLGPHTPEPLGDYLAGPSHVLPTEGMSRFMSPLGVEDFVKRSSLLSYSREALAARAKAVETLAEMEGLIGHARSVRVRFEE